MFGQAILVALGTFYFCFMWNNRGKGILSTSMQVLCGIFVVIAALYIVSIFI